MFDMAGMSFEYLLNINKYTGRDDLLHIPLINIIRYKKVIDDITIPPPPVLVESCTRFNCVCWKYNIRGCSTYKLCIKCYNTFSECEC
jgi:hypothetical protein